MSLDENDDIRPRPEIWEKAVIGLAALLTLSGIGVAFFSFTLKPGPQPKPVPEPTEVTIGIGDGSAIHRPPPINIIQPSPQRDTAGHP